jgi:predicted nucleic acid-binding protein
MPSPALAIVSDQPFLTNSGAYVTTDYVVGELIDCLYDASPEAEARKFIQGLLTRADTGVLQLVHISTEFFHRAWQMLQNYHDKPDDSFVDLTSMILMQDLGIPKVFMGDDHFRQVNLGFRLLP